MQFTIENRDTSACLSTYGGEMLSFRYKGVEYLWNGDPQFWDRHAPILFPVVCTPKDLKMAHGGVEYPMPKHGFAIEKEFTPILQTPARVQLALCEDEETLTMFPFRFRLMVEYAVTEGGFSASFTVTNRDRKPMTYCIGGHPGFRCPMFPGDDFSDYKLVFRNAKGAYVTGTDNGLMAPDLPHLDKIHDNTLDLSYETFAGDTLIVQDLPDAHVQLIHKKTGHGVDFDFTGLSALGLWTMSEPDEHSPFLCLEPWNGLPASSDETTDAKSKKYARTLQPGESHTVGYWVTVL